MYQAPRLEKFGTLREMTRGLYPGKTQIGDDQIPGIGLDCNPRVPPSDPTGCVRS